MTGTYAWRDRHQQFGRFLFPLWLAVFGGPLLAQGTCTPGPSTVCIAPASPLPSGDMGAFYSQNLTVSGGTGTGYNWIITAGALPNGLAIGSGGCFVTNSCQISGTPTAAGPSSFTIQVTDSAGNIGSTPYALTINPPPAITTVSPLPGGVVGTGYSQGVTVTGGTLPYYWGITAGALPLGLSLDSASCPPFPGGLLRPGLSRGLAGRRPGLLNPDARVKPQQESVCLIEGTPTASGSATFTLLVEDNYGEQSSEPFTINIVNPPLAITTTSPLPPGDVGAFYSQNLTASGGNGIYNWTVTAGALPTGLSLGSSGSPCTGNPCQILGTPTTAGPSSFTVQLTDSVGDQPATGVFALTINPPPTITTGSPLPAGTMGAAYSQGVTVSGGTPPYYWEQTAGTFPPGINLDPTTCPAPPENALLRPVLNRGGVERRTLLKPGGRVKPQQQSACLIVGTPQTTGAFNFNLLVEDSYFEPYTAQFSLTINPPPLITTTSLATGTVGVSYGQTLAASGGTLPLTWTLTSGTLPAGLVLSSAGQISGTPIAAGTANITIQVTDINLASNAKAFTLTIDPPLVISSSSPLPSGTVANTYSQVLTATGGSGQYFNWTVIAGVLPLGLSLNSGGGQISGTPTTAGSSNFTVQVNDSNNVITSKAFALTIFPPPLITTNSPLPPGTVKVPYSQTLVATGGAPPLTWTITAGLLPAGLALSSAGQISGTPTTAGTSDITVQVADANGVTATKPLVLTINPPLVITTSSPLASGTVGVSYSQLLTATGGSGQYTWTVITGALPLGLSLNSTAGQISGTPTTAGAANFTILVTDSNKVTATTAYTLNVIAVLTITNVSPLTSGAVGVPYTQTLTAVGGVPPYTWTLTQGALPAGLLLNSGTGQITGTPTAAGTSAFGIQVKDSRGQIATNLFEVVIGASTLTISTLALPAGTVAAPYTQTLMATGGKQPYNWTLIQGTLPAPLSLNATSGLISGTPTASGTSTFTVQVTDSFGTKISQQYSLIINPTVAITSASPLTGGTADLAYTFMFQASGGTQPYTWAVSAGALPVGITLTASTGLISGKPTAGGTANFTMQVTDANGAMASAPFTLTIAPNPAITTATLPPPVLGSPYSIQLSAAGSGGPFTWSLINGSLPNGLTLSTAGLISGTPTAPGTFTFTLQVTDSLNNSTSVPFTLTVPQVPLSLTIQAPAATPLQQIPVTVTLQQAYPVDLEVELTLQFTPNPAEPVADPTIMFNTGGTTVQLKIPAGQTSPVLATPLELQVGSIAGQIVLTANATAGGVPVTVSTTPEFTLNLAQEPPGIVSVTITQASSGFTVMVTGYSNTREITQASFTFTPQAGSQVQTTTFTPSGVAAAFQSWYAADASDMVGSQFLYMQPFTITSGSVSTLQSVTVTLTNSQGTSSTASANF